VRAADEDLRIYELTNLRIDRVYELTSGAEISGLQIRKFVNS